MEHTPRTTEVADVVQLSDPAITGISAVCAGQVWEIRPEYARGVRGKSMTVIPMYGTPFHSTNVWHRGSAPEGSVPDVVLRPDLVRDRIGNAIVRNDGTVGVAERVLVQPPDVGYNGPGEVIDLQDLRARDFLMREIKYKRSQLGPLQRGLPPPAPDTTIGRVIASNEMFVLQQDTETSKVYILELEKGRTGNRKDLAGSNAVTQRTVNGTYEIIARTLAESERPIRDVSFAESRENRKAVAGIVHSNVDGTVMLLDERDHTNHPMPSGSEDLIGRAVVAIYRHDADGSRQTRVYPVAHRHLPAISSDLQTDTELWRSVRGVEPKTVGAILLPEADLWQAQAILDDLEQTGNRLHAFTIVALGKHGDHLVIGTDENEVSLRFQVPKERVSRDVSASKLYELADGHIDRVRAEIKVDNITMEEDHERTREGLQKTRESTNTIDTGRGRDNHSDGRSIKRP